MTRKVIMTILLCLLGWGSLSELRKAGCSVVSL